MLFPGNAKRRRIASFALPSYATITRAQFRRLALDAQSALFDLVGNAVAFLRSTGGVSSPGTFSVTGQVATLKRAAKVTADPGSYAYTGQTASFVYGKTLPASVGAFAYTGQNAALTRALSLGGAGATFAMTGQAATLVAPGAATRTFITTYNDETDATSYTATGVSFSTASATRAIVVAVMGRVPSGNPVAPTSVTIGGVSASLVVSKETAADRNSASLWIAAVPTGTSGDIVVDFGGVTQQRCGLGWWATYNLSSLTAHATNSSDVSGAALDVNTQAGGLAFGMGDSGSATATTFTWTGLTEDFDIAVGSGNGWFTGASLETASASTPLAITCTATVATNDMYVTASFR